MKKKLYFNTLSSLFGQLITIVCGLILPRVILEYYGSNVNGLVSSISQFISFISLLDMGIGVVVYASMYGPLANKDNVKLSQIMLSAKRFFNKIIVIFLVYLVFLTIFFPLTITEYDYLYTASLIVILSLSTIFQYYFGMVNQLLLNADQKIYIVQFLNAGTLLLNTIISVILIKYFHVGIHVIKFVSSGIYVLRPLVMSIYVNKHYKINYKVSYVEEPIKQKYNGLYQHFSSVILNNTDIVILTFLSSLSNVSIYSVYNLVLSGIKGVIFAITNSLNPFFGRLIATNDEEQVVDNFKKMELFVTNFITYVFICTILLIIDFVKVYTNNINDANYIVYEFAYIFCLAQYIYCYRLSYNIFIQAKGMFKETQNSAIVEAMLNIIVSLALTPFLGLTGVSIGTCISMLYRTCYLIYFCNKNILKESNIWSIKIAFCMILSFILSLLSLNGLTMLNIGYLSWIRKSMLIAVFVFIIQFIINYIFFGRQFRKYIAKKYAKEINKWYF